MNLVRSILLAGALATSGCRNGHEGFDQSEATGPQFSAKNGLFLPEETRRSIALEMAEVKEQRGKETVQFEARVYGREGKLAKASGMLRAEQGKLLGAGQAGVVKRAEGGDLAAEVRMVSEHAVGQVEALVEIADAPEGMQIGTALRVVLELEGREGVMTIPRTALLECTEGAFVYTASGEHFVRTLVKVGSVSDDLVQVSDGLLAGDQVVVKPVMTLWMTELAAVKGGQACCIAPPKGK